MKETYLTKENINDCTDTILERCSAVNNKKREILFGKNAALLVIDAQEYFLNPESPAFAPSSVAVTENINKLIQLFEVNKLPVIFTKHGNTDSNAGMMKIWWKRLLEENSFYSEISKNILLPGDSVMINKTQYNAFYQSTLKDILTQKNVRSLIICGFLTNLCVETSIRESFVRGYNSVLPLDATCAYKYEYHLASCINLSNGFCSLSKTHYILQDFLND